MTDFHPADEYFRSAVGFVLEDAHILRFRYHLLRLRLAGLTDQDVEELTELARLVFQGSDVRQQTASIRKRADASPLAVTIAGVVDEAASGLDLPFQAPDLKHILMGAVFGAYLNTAEVPDVEPATVASIGALAGAVTIAVSTTTMGAIARIPPDEYVRTQN